MGKKLFYRFRKNRVYGDCTYTEFVILNPELFRSIPGKAYGGSTLLDFYRYLSEHFPEWVILPPEGNIT